MTTMTRLTMLNLRLTFRRLSGALLLVLIGTVLLTPRVPSQAAPSADDGTATSTPTVSPTPYTCPPPAASLTDPKALLDCATQIIQQSKALKIKLQVSGAPAIVTGAVSMGSIPIQFLTADGEYVAPDAVYATVKAKLAGIAGQVDVIAIGDDQWYRNAILTGNKYLKATFSPGFKPANLISSGQGIQSALQSVSNLTLVGKENLFGQDVYHLTGIADGVKVTSLTVGLIVSKASVNLDIYIDTTTLQAVEIVIVQPETVTTTEPDPTRWDLELFDYDVLVTVTPPPDALIPPTLTNPPAATADTVTATP